MLFFGVKWQWIGIGPGKCLALDGRQTFICISDGLLNWRIYHSVSVSWNVVGYYSSMVRFIWIDNKLILIKTMTWLKASVKSFTLLNQQWIIH